MKKRPNRDKRRGGQGRRDERRKRIERDRKRARLLDQDQAEQERDARRGVRRRPPNRGEG